MNGIHEIYCNKKVEANSAGGAGNESATRAGDSGVVMNFLKEQFLCMKEKIMAEQLTKDGFLKKVFNYEKNKEWKFEGDIPAVVDFWAPWCGPCRMVGPIIDELSTEYAGKVNYYKINVDDEQELAGIFGVRSIPSMLFIPKEGKPKMSIGALPKEALVSAMTKELNISAN